MHSRVSAQRVPDNDEQKITDGDNQSHGETNRRLAPMRGDPKRHPNNRKSNASERKGKTLVYFRPAGAAFALVFTLELLEQLLNRQRRPARPFFLLLVKLVKADGNVPSTALIPSRIFLRLAGSFGSRS